MSNVTNVSIIIVKGLIKLQNLLELIKARLSDCSKILSKDNMENEELLQHLMTTCRKVFEKHRIPLTILTWKHHPTPQGDPGIKEDVYCIEFVKEKIYGLLHAPIIRTEEEIE